jgi:hypothetical protein
VRHSDSGCVGRVCAHAIREATGSATPDPLLARQRDKAVKLGEKQSTNMELRNKSAAFDQARNLHGRDELDLHARFGRKSVYAPAGLHEEGMDPVVEASGAWKCRSEEMDFPRGEPGLFNELAPATVNRIFSRIDKTRRQLPGECFKRRPVLAHDRNLSAARERDDCDIVGLLDGVIGLRLRAAPKKPLFRADLPPTRWPSSRRLDD